MHSRPVAFRLEAPTVPSAVSICMNLLARNIRGRLIVIRSLAVDLTLKKKKQEKTTRKGRKEGKRRNTLDQITLAKVISYTRTAHYSTVEPRIFTDTEPFE